MKKKTNHSDTIMSMLLAAASVTSGYSVEPVAVVRKEK